MNIVFMSMDTLPSTLWARDLYDQILNPAKSTASSSRTYPDLVVITLRWESIWNRFFP